MERPSVCNGPAQRRDKSQGIWTKNPLLEYKSEGFGMFKEMMRDMNAVTVQRMFLTQLQGMEQAPKLKYWWSKEFKSRAPRHNWNGVFRSATNTRECTSKRYN